VRCPVALLLCSVVAVAVAAPAASAADPCPGAGTPLDQLGPGAARAATLCLLNRERGSRGRAPLRADARLRRAAQAHSDDMVAHRYFAHDSRDGAGFGARIRATGWTRHRRSYTVGENLGFECGDRATPAAMVGAWMHSAGHRANILERRFRAIGIGVAAGTPSGEGGATYSTDFGGA
jgi:uncharacterized protein YkwD